jgi:hypothetical protein
MWHHLLQSLSTLDGCCSALQALYDEQQAKKGMGSIRKLRENVLYQKTYTKVKNNMAEKGQRTAGKKDPQDGTAEDTLTPDQMLALAHLFMAKGTSDADRNLAMSLWAYSTVMRGDDTRLLFVPDLIKPVKLTCVGECLTSAGLASSWLQGHCYAGSKQKWQSAPCTYQVKLRTGYFKFNSAATLRGSNALLPSLQDAADLCVFLPAECLCKLHLGCGNSVLFCQRYA